MYICSFGVTCKVWATTTGDHRRWPRGGCAACYGWCRLRSGSKLWKEGMTGSPHVNHQSLSNPSCVRHGRPNDAQRSDAVLVSMSVQIVTRVGNYGCFCCMFYQFYLCLGNSLSMICMHFSILWDWVAEITVKKKHQELIQVLFIYQRLNNVYLSCITLCRAPLVEDIITVSLLFMEVMNYGGQNLNIHFLVSLPNKLSPLSRE